MHTRIYAATHTHIESVIPSLYPIIFLFQYVPRCCQLSSLILNFLQDERNQILTAYLWIRQVWVDAYLKWNKDDYDGLDTIRIPSSYVWRPDIVLYNK